MRRPALSSGAAPSGSLALAGAVRPSRPRAAHIGAIAAAAIPREYSIVRRATRCWRNSARAARTIQQGFVHRRERSGVMDNRDRFARFTERACRVLSLAQEEAQRFNHNYIGTEHLLLGLVREGDGVAAKVLNNLGVELSKVRSAVEFIIGRGEKSVAGEIGLTPRAKKVIELAVEEARRLNHSYIGT